MEHLYEYMSKWYSDGRSERSVCQARRTFVEMYIPRREFAELFGGYVLSTDSSGEEYLGVWSRKMGQRFRRLLRERGAQFETGKEPPNLKLKHTYVSHSHTSFLS
jgi:hypothetical protein